MTPEIPSSPHDPHEPRLARIPAFQSGGYVQKTGIALIHEGEYILPAPGSEARITAEGPPGSGQTVHYHFPIEVEVIGALNLLQLKQIAQYVHDGIRDALPV